MVLEGDAPLTEADVLVVVLPLGLFYSLIQYFMINTF